MIFGEPWRPKTSWHWSYRWGKTPKKSRPGNLSRLGIDPGPAAWEARMLPPAPQQWIVLYCIFGFKGASTSQVIGAPNEMMIDDNDGQMIFGDLVGLKVPDIRLTGEEKPRKNPTQETCPNRGSNPGPLRDKCACYHLFHNSGHNSWTIWGLTSPKSLMMIFSLLSCPVDTG